MKKTLHVALIGSVALPASAAIIAEDNFLVGSDPSAGQYEAGTAVVPASPTTTGYTGAWQDAPFNDVSHTVGATSLSYSDPNYLGSSGGSLTSVNSARNGRNLATTYDDSFAGTVYLSFLMQVDAPSTAGSYRAFEGWDGAGLADGPNRNFQLGVHTPGGNTGDFGDVTQFGFRLNNSNTTRATLGAFDSNVNLWVVRFDFSNTAGGDSATVWKNPVIDGTEPAGGTTVSGADLQIGSLGLARFSGAGLALDEIRLGDTFSDVTGVPEPSSVLLSFLGALALIRRRR